LRQNTVVRFGHGVTDKQNISCRNRPYLNMRYKRETAEVREKFGVDDIVEENTHGKRWRDQVKTGG